MKSLPNMEESASFAKNHLKTKRLRLINATMIIVLNAAIVLLDYLTGYQRSIIALYGLPIALMAWNYGTLQGIGLSILSLCAWGWADIASGHPYESLDLFIFNAVNCLVFFLAVVYGVHFATRSAQLNLRLRRAFSGDIVICSQCEKIRSPDDHWSKFEDYLIENSSAMVMHKVCPDCARQGYALFSEKDTRTQAL